MEEDGRGAEEGPEARVDALMDGLREDLERLTAIPSIAFPGYPPGPVEEAHDLAAFVREYAADFRAAGAPR